MTVSPLAPLSFPDLPPLAGVEIGAANCGIKYTDRPDLLLMRFAPGTQVGGVFTRSLTAAAPVEWCREVLREGSARALVVNAGNANAFTGRAGRESVARVVGAASELCDCSESAVYVASTGVIGVPLPDAKITDALPAIAANLTLGWLDAAKAIMTTDTFPKLATRTATIGGAKVTIHGIAKGSGMIAPDMATMLAFIVTDAKLPALVLQDLITEGSKKSFNSITVDSDTSTSDTALFFATGKAGNPTVVSINDPPLAEFRARLDELLIELAQAIVKDGEGATKFVTVHVSGAASDQSARKIGLAIGNSPLVKTAIAGEDANWGRIVAAVGKSGEWADRDKLSIRFGDVVVAEHGMVHPDYREDFVVPMMKESDIRISVDVGVGTGHATIWTCDLTHRYIDINASYRS